jgi:phytol kinase
MSAFAFVQARPWLGIALVLGTLGLALVVLRWAQARYALTPEWARKGIHMTMGAVTLLLPWLFEGAAPVVVLAVIALALMAAVRRVPALRARVGGVIHGVARRSYGEVYFPLAVLVLYLLAAETPVLYVVPLLLLTLADPAAALVGLRHGFVPYATVDGRKSREGSVAFFAVAFLCVHVPLLLFTATGRAESLLVACIVGILATMLEAISWRGLDNLFVPLGTYVLLVRLLGFSAPLRAAHLGVLVALIGVAALARRRTTLGGSAVLGAVLVGYVTWAVGGTIWLLAPAVVFATHARLWPRPGAEGTAAEDRPHTVHHVLSVTSVGTAWLLAARLLDGPGLLFPYTLAYAGYLALFGVERLRAARPGWPPARLLHAATLRSTAVQVLPLLAYRALRGAPALAPTAAVYLGLGVLAVGLAAFVAVRYARQMDEETTDFEGRVLRALLVAVTSSLGLLAPLLLP